MNADWRLGEFQVEWVGAGVCQGRHPQAGWGLGAGRWGLKLELVETRAPGTTVLPAGCILVYLGSVLDWAEWQGVGFLCLSGWLGWLRKEAGT